MAYDPICGKKVRPDPGTPKADYRKRTYYFCSEACRRALLKAAERQKLHDAARAGSLLTPGKIRWGSA